MRALERLQGSEPATRPPWPASLSIGFTLRDGKTIATRSHRGPLILQKALYPEGPEVCHAIVVHPPGGIAGGDSLALRFSVARGSRALVTAPGMTRWYRTEALEAEQRVSAEVDGGVLEWLSPGGIVFDGARSRMDLEVELRGGGRFLGWDLLVLGRAASGERFTRGSVCRHTRIRSEGRTIWSERIRVEASDRLWASPVGLRGSTVSATFLAAGVDAGQGLLDACRTIALEEGGAAAGLSALPGVLVGQYLGDSSEKARRWLEAIWRLARPTVAGRSAVPPRIWST